MTAVMQLAILLVAFLLSGVWSFQPWLDTCDNTAINIIHGSSPYGVGVYEASVNATTRWFIISLCNRTDKWPKNTSQCTESSSYFVAVWDATGHCLGSFNVATSLAGNGSVGNPLVAEFRSNVTQKWLSLQVTCNASAGSGIDVTSFEALTPAIMTVQAQSSDLCTASPTPAPTNASSGSWDDGLPDRSPPNAWLVVALVVAVVGVLGFGLRYRIRQRSYVLLSRTDDHEDGAGDLEPHTSSVQEGR